MPKIRSSAELRNSYNEISTFCHHLLDEAEQKINALAQFPQQHPLVEDTILASWEIRFTQAGNYLAFYIVSDGKKR